MQSQEDNLEAGLGPSAAVASALVGAAPALNAAVELEASARANAAAALLSLGRPTPSTQKNHKTHKVPFYLGKLTFSVETFVCVYTKWFIYGCYFFIANYFIVTWQF